VRPVLLVLILPALAASALPVWAQAKAPPKPAAAAKAEAQAQAQDTTSVAVRVTEVSGESVFLDQGSDAGIDVNQRVLLYSRTFGILSGRIRAVTKNSSNCTLEAGSLPVTAGTPGEVLVPKKPPPPLVVNPGPENPATPEHPPWSAPPENWKGDAPLLRPAFAKDPQERPTEVTGFSFVHGSYSSNTVGLTNEYYLAEAGTDLTLTNVASWGGMMKVRAEYLYESAALEGAKNFHENDFRVDWFEYVLGNVRHDDLRLAVGRFLHNEFVELDVIDGAEVTTKLFNHLRVGGSAGALVDPRRTLTLTGDYEASIYTRYVSGPKEELCFGAAFQKTMHDGARDRDLLVATGEFVPSANFSARASVWIDYYTAHELAKPEGYEVTEAHAYASYRINAENSVGAFFSRNRIPDTLRNQLAPDNRLPTPEEAELLRQNLSIYYGAYSFHQLTKTIVADTRINLWQDQTSSTGASGELHAGFRDLLLDRSEAGFTAFYTDGIYTKGPGGRLTFSYLWSPVNVISWYELAYYENVSTQEQSLQQSLHLSVDAAASDTWTMSLSLDYRFGYQQDSFTFFLSIMKRIR
jgi:hypothetical protein